jgi:hypothetical protein
MSESTAASPPRVFRRRSTVVTGYTLAGMILVIAIILTVPVIGHGFWAVLAAPVAGLTLILITYAMSVKPNVVVGDQQVEVNNSFASFDVPFDAVDEVRQTRMGLVLRTKAGRNIALSGYANGMGGRVVGHKEAADAVIQAVETGQRAAGKGDDDKAAVSRRWDVRLLVAVPAAVAVTVLVIVAAAHTYH